MEMKPREQIRNERGELIILREWRNHKNDRNCKLQGGLDEIYYATDNKMTGRMLMIKGGQIIR